MERQLRRKWGLGAARRGARGRRPSSHRCRRGARGGRGRLDPVGMYIGVGTHQDTMQKPDILYKAPTDYTNPQSLDQKPQKTKESLLKD